MKRWLLPAAATVALLLVGCERVDKVQARRFASAIESEVQYTSARAAQLCTTKGKQADALLEQPMDDRRRRELARFMADMGEWNLVDTAIFACAASAICSRPYPMHYRSAPPGLLPMGEQPPAGDEEAKQRFEETVDSMMTLGATKLPKEYRRKLVAALADGAAVETASVEVAMLCNARNMQAEAQQAQGKLERAQKEFAGSLAGLRTWK